jgi:hypothetical protein
MQNRPNNLERETEVWIAKENALIGQAEKVPWAG